MGEVMIKNTRKIYRLTSEQIKNVTYFTYYKGFPVRAYGNNIYLNGSLVEMTQDKVLFENHLTPSGDVLFRWNNTRNHQVDRAFSDCPFFEKGQSYRMKRIAQIIPEKSVYTRILLLSREGETLQEIIEFEEDFTFTCEVESCHGIVEIVNMGSQSIVFQCCLLEELDSEKNYELEIKNLRMTLLNPDPGSLHATVVVTDSLPHQVVTFASDMWQSLTNVWIISSLAGNMRSYCNSQVTEAIREQLQQYEKIDFIGYNPRTNIVSSLYANQWRKNHQLFLSTESFETEQKTLESEFKQLLSSAIFKTMEQAIRYGKLTEKADDFAAFFYDDTIRLNELPQLNKEV